MTRQDIRDMGKGCPENIIRGAIVYHDMRLHRGKSDIQTRKQFMDSVEAEINRIFDRWRRKNEADWRVKNFVEKA